MEEISAGMDQREALRQTEEIIPLDQIEQICLLDMLHAEQVLDLQILIQIHGDKMPKARSAINSGRESLGHQVWRGLSIDQQQVRYQT